MTRSPLPLAAHVSLAALAALALAALAAPRAADAQFGAPAAPPPRFGVMAGLNLADISDVDDQGGETETRKGLVAGVYATVPLTRAFSFQAELLYAQRGAQATLTNDPDLGDAELQLDLDYVEVPVLLRLDVPTASTGIRPHLYVGPTFAFNVGCRLEARVGPVSIDEDCEELADGFEPKSFDAGAMIGGGIAFPLSGATQLTVGARYTFGLTNVFDDTGDADPRHRVLAVYGAIDLPFGGRR